MELDERTSLWLKHLRTWQQSGATQDAYCKTNGIHPKTFSNWKRRLRDHLFGLPKLTRSRSVPPNPVAPLVAVKLFDDLDGDTTSPAKPLEFDMEPVPEPAPQKTSSINLSVGKYQISIADDFDSAALRRLLDVLGEQ